MDLNISPDDINQYLANTIIQSAIGTTLKATIEEQVKTMGRSYDNPYKKHVEAEIIRLTRELIEAEFQEQIKEQIRQKLTDEFIESVINALWDKFYEKRF